MKLKLFYDEVKNRTWAVRRLDPGDMHGTANQFETRQPMVEFYDTNYEHTDFGQFVSRYYVSTLLHSGCPNGLDLQGDVPAWKIAAPCMGRVINWLKEN